MNERHVDFHSGLIYYLNYFKVFELHILLLLFNVRVATLDLIGESLTVFWEVFNRSYLAQNINVDIWGCIISAYYEAPWLTPFSCISHV